MQFSFFFSLWTCEVFYTPSLDELSLLIVSRARAQSVSLLLS